MVLSSIISVSQVRQKIFGGSSTVRNGTNASKKETTLIGMSLISFFVSEHFLFRKPLALHLYAP
jgi:hypothetical protein